jgi:DNA (cytosine-5)-methyltransferase 1
MGKKSPLAIDLFCGAGGLTLGLKQAGFKVVGAVDNDKAACESYLLNHSDVNLWEGDIRELSGEVIMKSLKLKPGELDLLAGCPPCQGFSTIRTHNKLPVTDARNDLVFEFLRIAREMMPKTIMMENVPGLAKDQRMKEFVRELTSLGYVGEPSVVNVAEYGVPQRRRRMIYLAGLGHHIEMAIPKFNRRTSVREAIASLPKAGTSGDQLHDYPESRTEKIKQMIRLIPKDGGSRTDLPARYVLECHKRNPLGFKDVYGRMKWDDVSPTITGGCSNPSKGRFLHPEEDRTITLREAALLQTFPRDYKFSMTGGKQKIALQIGNALPPKFIEVHAREISRFLSHQ